MKSDSALSSSEYGGKLIEFSSDVLLHSILSSYFNIYYIDLMKFCHFDQ